MFRVKENSDGSVSIFSNDENRSFICSVEPRSPNKNLLKSPPRNIRNGNIPTSPTRYLVSKLSPNTSKQNRSSARRSGRNCSSRQRRKDGGQYYEDDNDTSSLSSYTSSTSTFSLASTISIESSREPDDDCLDQWSFCRMLDLIESKRLCSSEELVKELRRTFPMRKISCQSRWQETKNRLPKRTDIADICSRLGQNILHAHPPRTMVPYSMDSAVSKYERFCKSSVVSLQPITWQSPLLRAREVRSKFPVTYKSEKGYIHKYSFTRKQRLERHKQLRIGLSRRSYLLKRKCKKMSVQVQRLSQGTIDLYCNPRKPRMQNGLPASRKKTESEQSGRVRLPSRIYVKDYPKPVTSLLRKVSVQLFNSLQGY